jgi:hypothetical protein
MRVTLAILIGSVVMCACAATSALGGSALVKAPVEQQCSRYGLKGCPELVDGVLLYVSGDERAATLRLKRAASKNVPAKIQRFARAISIALPAESGSEIVAILTGEVADEEHDDGIDNEGIDEEALAEEEADEEDTEESTGARASFSGRFQSGATPARFERVQLSMAAQTDPTRLTTESVSPLRDADRTLCQIGGSDAVCVRLESGPLIVTDAVTPPGCTTELIIGATNADGRIGWIAPASSPGFHGARFFVRSNQWVVVAARGSNIDEPGDERCYVTWAAFKPRVWMQNM